MSNILVTGGTGFIGSHTCLALLKKKHKVISLDSYINSSPESFEQICKYCNRQNIDIEDKFFNIKCDLRNINQIDKVFYDFKKINLQIDAVIHFAGLKNIVESYQKPLQYWEYNVCSSINLFKVLEKYNCKTIVFSSSASIYSAAQNPYSLKEDSELAPKSPYGNTKLTIEKILHSQFQFNKELKIANLRYFNPAGAHESGLIGDNPSGIPSNIFPLLNRVALGFDKNLKIFGNDWITDDGTCVRDFIHVNDLAEAHVSCLSNLFQSDPVYVNLNLGSGYGTSIKNLIQVYEKVNNCIIPCKYVNRRIGDSAVLVADITKALSILNWSPKRNLEDICKDSYKFDLMRLNSQYEKPQFK